MQFDITVRESEYVTYRVTADNKHDAVEAVADGGGMEVDRVVGGMVGASYTVEVVPEAEQA